MVRTKNEGASAQGAPSRRRVRSRHEMSVGRSLLWIGPSLLLIIGIVLFPAIKLVQASFGRYSITGLQLGDAGGRNYDAVVHHPMFPTVLGNTAIWVVSVVFFTIVLSLAIAQFVSKEFFGRRFVRIALIIPWAASLVITAQVFVLLYDYNYGELNPLLQALHIIPGPINWLGDDRFTLFSMIVVGIFVSIPFTVFVFLAGLSGIPDDVNEAALVDGASAWQRYRHITLPLLRPSLLIATTLNTIYVFNSFPIIYTLNDRNPGYAHDTLITFMYKLAFKSQEKDVGMSAAMGVINVAIILVVVLIYLRIVDPRKDESLA